LIISSFMASPNPAQLYQSVGFRDISTGIITHRQWNFGDGTVTNTLNTFVVYKYITNGSMDVILTVFGPMRRANSSTNTVIVSPPTGTVGSPTITPNGGHFTFSVMVGLSVGTPSSGVSIYYTTNGVTPDLSSTLYTEYITLPNPSIHPVTLKAIGYAVGYLPSPVSSANFY